MDFNLTLTFLMKEIRKMKRKIIKLGRMLEKVFEDDSITETLLLNLKQFEK